MAENDPALARMLARVAAWQAAVDSYRAALALEQGADGDALPSSRGTIELPVNAFRGMTMNEAIKLLLKSVQRKQTTQEIAEGLKNGGLVSTAKDIGPTLRSALNKLKVDGTLLRFSDGWDLAEAHSAMIRHRITKENAKPSKRPNKKSKPKAEGHAKAKAATTADASAVSLDSRALEFLREHPGASYTPKQLAEGLGLPDASKLILALSRMVRYKKAVKTLDGRYLLPAA